jgi:hypothetical protein
VEVLAAGRRGVDVKMASYAGGALFCPPAIFNPRKAHGRTRGWGATRQLDLLRPSEPTSSSQLQDWGRLPIGRRILSFWFRIGRLRSSVERPPWPRADGLLTPRLRRRDPARDRARAACGSISAATTNTPVKVVTADPGYAAYGKMYGGLERRGVDPVIPAKKEPIRSRVPLHRFRYDAKHDIPEMPTRSRSASAAAGIARQRPWPDI